MDVLPDVKPALLAVKRTVRVSESASGCNVDGREEGGREGNKGALGGFLS